MTVALVEQPAGAFLMFSRAVWEMVGGFDERSGRSGLRMSISARGSRPPDFVRITTLGPWQNIPDRTLPVD